MLSICQKLAGDAEFVLNSSASIQPMFIGLFSYDIGLKQTAIAKVLSSLQKAANGNPRRVINHVAMGRCLFVRFWRLVPDRSDETSYDYWHGYSLADLAYGYFIHNLLHTLSVSSVTENRSLYFPFDGKEEYLTGTLPLQAR